ncbi:MAG: hypothetical protein ABSG89_05760 [Bacteroidales bacterium]|jgi:hypothetical protein
MKQKLYILGVMTTIIISAGAVFKVNHWPAAAILLVTGTLLLVFLFLPAALINNYRVEGNKQNKVLYIVTYITCFVVFMAMLFKIMHWPYAGLWLTISLPFPYVVFLPVFLTVTSKNRNFNIYNTVFVLLLLALNSVFSTLLALNVSKESITDSYNLSKDYCRIEASMTGLPAADEHSAVNLKIDEVLKIADNYQDLIFKHEGITRDQWKKDPGNLQDAESVNIPMQILTSDGESYPGDRLQQALKELVTLMQQTKDWDATARALPSILGFAGENSADPDWTIRNVAQTNLSWVLIYLDGLEASLKMIKASYR